MKGKRNIAGMSDILRNRLSSLKDSDVAIMHPNIQPNLILNNIMWTFAAVCVFFSLGSIW